MKELYEIGFVFRGFVIVHHSFKKLPKLSGKEYQDKKDLRGAFVSAISSFVESAFNNTSLEYLESGDVLFVFKMAKIQSSDNYEKEPIILYGLIEKKKKSDKLVKKFLEKIEPLMLLFIQKYSNKDFCELNQFELFKKNIIAYFKTTT
ncbi:MAG: hypothetical protein JW891_12885 [Candidatus Lokiarchaeota archaeon]|nr:hypothetical protein [Candidatus Lokiarchaeota archaeon]